MNSYRTIEKESSITEEIKRSKFIAHSFIVTDEKSAAEKLADMRKSYSDASHVCYAYVLANGAAKNSDDKEPAKTAGYPILEAIKGRNLHNTMVAVVRYFGGVKLGTGGLARAYGGAAAMVLEQSGILNYVYSVKFIIRTGYQYAAAVENAANNYGEVISKAYYDGAEITAVCPSERFEGVAGAINGATAGGAEIIPTGEIFYPYKK